MKAAALRPAVARVVGALPGAVRAQTEAASDALAAFLELLSEKNEEMNLVSARAAEPDALSGHLADALAGLRFLPPPRPGPLRLLDLGSGGGLPAVPLLLVRRDIEGTLVDSIRKKCEFLSAAAGRLALTARVVNARFPDSFPMPKSGPFDVLTTRAVGSAGALVRAARPVLARGARALLWTTEPLVKNAVRESGAKTSTFHRDPGSERRGLLVLERFT
jgi:16S rRNA (guanine527-N7)-methyltransferase